MFASQVTMTTIATDEAQGMLRELLQKCIRESPRVAEAHAKVLAAKTGDPQHLPAALDNLTDAISELCAATVSDITTAGENIPDALREHLTDAIGTATTSASDTMAAAKQLFIAARRVKIAEDNLHEAFIELRARRHDDEATASVANEALIAAIRETKIAQIAVNDAFELLRAAKAAPKANIPACVLELATSSPETDAKLTRDVGHALRVSFRLVDLAEEAVLKKAT